MSTIKSFFESFGLPAEWIDEDGDIFINKDDSDEMAAINSGDEVIITADEVSIDGRSITIKAKSTLTTDFFAAVMGDNDDAGNMGKMISAINEVIDGRSWDGRL